MADKVRRAHATWQSAPVSKSFSESVAQASRLGRRRLKPPATKLAGTETRLTKIIYGRAKSP